MFDNLIIQRFEFPPSASEFDSLIESRNAPTDAFRTGQLYRSVIRSMAASTICRNECAGSCIVEAMLTRTAPVFYGDLRSHERIPLPFSTFFQFCKRRLQESSEENVVSTESDLNKTTCPDMEKDCLSFEDDPKKYT